MKDRSVVAFMLGFATVVTGAIFVLLLVTGQAKAALPAKNYTGMIAVNAGPTASPTVICDPEWQTVTTTNVISAANSLSDIDGVAVDDLWAVGTVITTTPYWENSLINHWNGSVWNIVPSTNITYSNALNSVAVVDYNNVWAVGHYFDGSVTHTLIEHWDGNNWSKVPSPDGGMYYNFLRSVSVINANDIWAVGHYSNEEFGPPAQTLTMHWDGAIWSVVPSPDISGENNKLIDVDALASNDVWAVGEHYTMSPNPIVSEVLVLHWNGIHWSEVDTPTPLEDDEDLRSVKIIAPNDVWAVGRSRDSQGADSYNLALHWDGNQWSHVQTPNVGANSNYLSGLDGLEPNNVWAVGGAKLGSVYVTVTMHWSGAAWNVVNSPNSGQFETYLSGVKAFQAEVWATGGKRDEFEQDYRTVSIRYRSPCFTSCAIEFTDVPVGSTFYQYVKCMACQGIINGYAAGCETGNPCFKPQNNVTRGQLSKIVANAAGFMEPTGVQQFEDVPQGSTFFDFVYRLASRGYVNGYACGGPGEPCGAGNLPYFRPNANITRGQISKIVSEAAGFDNTPTNQQFEDVPTDSTFFTWIWRLADRGIMSGYVCGGAGKPCVGPGNLPYFRPGNNTTRGQASKVVANTFFRSCQVR